MIRVLIVDDEPVIAGILVDAITEAFPGSECFQISLFEQALAALAKHSPDVVVLDLMRGAHSAELPGVQTWGEVWDTAFCPIVVYTGSDAPLTPAVSEAHPLVRRVQKGNGSEEQVVNELRGFVPAIEAINYLHQEVRAVIRKVLRDTAGQGHLPLEAAYILHAGRRRIAASMDDPTLTSSRAMAGWEQYLIPAVGDSPLTADLLRRRTSQWDDPTAFRLVLSPSCDLVKGRCEPTLISACCENATELVRKLSLSPKANKAEENAAKIKDKVLSSGSFEGWLPLPGFPSLLPVMVANLKNIEVIPWVNVGAGDSQSHEFVRVASIDSPFREQVVWAFLTTAGRPGMPDRDLKPWAEALLASGQVALAATPAVNQAVS